MKRSAAPAAVAALQRRARDLVGLDLLVAVEARPQRVRQRGRRARRRSSCSGDARVGVEEQRPVAARRRVDVERCTCRPAPSCPPISDVALGGEGRDLVHARAPDAVLRAAAPAGPRSCRPFRAGRPYSTETFLPPTVADGFSRGGGAVLCEHRAGTAPARRRPVRYGLLIGHRSSWPSVGRCRASASSAFFSSSFTSCGFALPPVFFITCPTNQPRVLVLPLRYVGHLLRARGQHRLDRRRAARPRPRPAPAPRAPRSPRGASPVAHIFSNTSFAILPLMRAGVDQPDRARPGARRRPGTRERRVVRPCSLRRTSVITQLDAAFALPLSRATASK